MMGVLESASTRQAMLGLNYALNWGELLLMYRHLKYDQDSDRLLRNFSFSGLALGVKFNF